MRRTLSLILALGLAVSLAHGEETRLVVRARAHDAKFIGTAVGGLEVTIAEARGGKVLAEGRIDGGTGDTKTLMKLPVERRQRIVDDKTAGFTARLDLEKPTKVKVTVGGPLAAGLGAQTQSKTLWLLPGRHIEGNGLIFDMHGFIVRPLSPAPNQVYDVGERVDLVAWVTMLCGCHIKPDGPWKPKDYSITAVVYDARGNKVEETPMSYTGKASTFSARFRTKRTGGYRVVITAADPKGANYGVGVSGFAVKDLEDTPDRTERDSTRDIIEGVGDIIDAVD